jgi:hypothetical protein
MKGVNNKLANSANDSFKKNALKNDGLKKDSQNRGKSKRRTESITANELSSINRRLDQCLPMETLEWERVEQLLMQMSEFAPTTLVYEAGMAVALYADDQARRAYLLGAADARAEEAAKHEAQHRGHDRARERASA